MPDPEELEEEETAAADEEDDDESPPVDAAAEALDIVHNDAEVMLRTTLDLVSELVDKERVPKTLLDTLDAAYDELVTLMAD